MHIIPWAYCGLGGAELGVGLQVQLPVRLFGMAASLGASLADPEERALRATQLPECLGGELSILPALL